MYDVTAIGEALIDFIPAQRDCALKEVESFTRVCGGAPLSWKGQVHPPQSPDYGTFPVVVQTPPTNQ